MTLFTNLIFVLGRGLPAASRSSNDMSSTGDETPLELRFHAYVPKSRLVMGGSAWMIGSKFS
jgi:hypothetical protein